MLLQLLKWLKVEKAYVEMDLLTLESGSLDDEFEIAVNFYFKNFKVPKSKRLLNRIFKLFFKNKNIFDKVAKNKYDLIYANTVVSLKAAKTIMNLQSGSAKLICHVHELDTIIDLLEPDFKNYIDLVDQFIAVSILVKTSLSERFGISKNKVSVINEFSDLVNKNNTMRTVLSDCFLVGGSGFVHWRKGTDVFLQVARYVIKHFPNRNIKFEWVGVVSDSERIILNSDLRKLGLESKVFFSSEQINPLSKFQEFDVFLLPSREDPFPLVCIEVGQLGIPVICFESGTGTAEVIEKGGGVIVPYLDIEAMAEAIVRYYDNPEITKSDGNLAKKYFSKFSSEIMCPKIYEVINNQLSTS